MTKGIVTVFDFTRMELLPPTANYFPVLPGQKTPVMASLPASRFAEIAAAIKVAKASKK